MQSNSIAQQEEYDGHSTKDEDGVIHRQQVEEQHLVTATDGSPEIHRDPQRHDGAGVPHRQHNSRRM